MNRQFSIIVSMGHSTAVHRQGFGPCLRSRTERCSTSYSDSPGNVRDYPRRPTVSLREFTRTHEVNFATRKARRKQQGSRRCRVPCSASPSEESLVLGKFHVSQRDTDILALLIPAIGSVFLDPAMQVIDTGTHKSLNYHNKRL
jgi:hypothetical protein